ncbi:MAG TPA: TetR/AcrR family transcriptional regulator [Pyrinomonadaceae bacterium]|jgi:AcrR family transcriptional regulator|nr:TetR/AcrR family transcriptional regulator [Pyrinomonadaceae bacterium]
MKDSVQPRSTRDAILDATDRLLAKYGYKKMTIDDLASEVGIGKGSVYLHFASKEEIALSHIDRIIERLMNRLVSIAASSDIVDKRLRKMMVERVLFRFDSVQHYSQSLNEMLANLRPRLLERRRRYFEEEARLFAQVLSEGKKAGVFTFRDPVVTANAILDATNSLLPYSLSVRELGERSEIETKTLNLADLILNGLGKR